MSSLAHAYISKLKKIIIHPKPIFTVDSTSHPYHIHAFFPKYLRLDRFVSLYVYRYILFTILYKLIPQLDEFTFFFVLAKNVYF